ncbi:glycosyltransferase [Vibrio proteolyticus]|uniref:Putative glycosyltransferase n=1 Tax=Vibrio proteolyticus NBRC 13287 TaxID=1219065 RepID=U3B678_VIBPR|nr:glycosyltransferase [Vibrio proteolyticus]GAD65339.1 putative glycosyltransferase [Vibrio proteolyticus NBRC 13287]
MQTTKRILYVHFGENWIRGSERCLIDLLSHLDRSRFEPLVWTNSRALNDAVTQLKIESRCSEFSVLMGWQPPKADVPAWLALVQTARGIIRSEAIDLVHVNSAAPCQWMILAASLEQTPLVTQIHSDYQARDRFTLALNLSPHIIAVSRAITKNLLQDGFPDYRISVIPNGIDTDALQQQQMVDVRQKLALRPNDVIYVSVGSLIKRKGMDRLIAQFANLKRDDKRAKLVIVGGGEEHITLTQQVHSMQLETDVFLVGEQPNSFGWMKGCDVFVSAARQEAFGLVLIEAALAGLPVIAPDIDGIPEVVEHQQNGLLYDTTCEAELYAAMLCVLQQPTYGQQLAARGREKVLTQFTIQYNAQRIQQIYQRFIAQPVSSPALHALFTPFKSYLQNKIA